ncbi:protein IQ-DOMAIN 20 [Diospyros lotus]|uniref:protein IQ-DOMAIN 20 n=1 Tax=Diospyros lotus TaxID=55363 RepID=UPI0022572C66|nr:protein IQ-DOMAIN 20 [Diospyros lotus]
MGNSRRWFGILRTRPFKTSPQETVTVFHTIDTTTTFSQELTTPREAASAELTASEKKKLSKEDDAAIKIQALFRGHLARLAFRALKSLVKLQAVVRGASVRSQARIALHCMHALARLHVTVRARQLLG